MDRIIVGVDGSDEARRALEWALEEAGYRRAAVHLVHGYEVPTAVGTYFGTVDLGPFRERMQEAAQHRLAAILADVEVPEGVPVTSELVEGLGPARVLLDRAKDADLLVVGSRGRGGFAGLLLGSVSQQCVHHAPCPVVVVRDGAPT